MCWQGKRATRERNKRGDPVFYHSRATRGYGRRHVVIMASRQRAIIALVSHSAKRLFLLWSPPHPSRDCTLMSDERPPMSPRTLLALIMGGLIVWGIYVAVGVLWYGLNPTGAIAVLVCVGMFLGFWLLLLRTQKRDKQE